MAVSSKVVEPNIKTDGKEPVHGWYRLIMGFEGSLVRYLIDNLSIKPYHRVLDPFCGAGTTLVECKREGIPSVGIDANPACVFASRVKTNWQLNPALAASLVPIILTTAQTLLKRDHLLNHEVMTYLSESGMIKRGWISQGKATKTVALLNSIDMVCDLRAYRNFFRLALANAVIRKIADIKFGPEVYCLRKPKRRRVFVSFCKTAEHMINDLVHINEHVDTHAKARVLLGDSRKVDTLLSSQKLGRIDFIITSPPYPSEHDYTRNTRLELVFLGYVNGNKKLRSLKRQMIRCHTKGIYVDDSDRQFAEQFPEVRAVTDELNKRARKRTDGFSRLYGRMVAEYFGGMVAHFQAAFRSVKPGGVCAYVVCDQHSLLGVHVNTPGILKSIATSAVVGFRLVSVLKWREIRGTTGSKTLTERILVLRKPIKTKHSSR